MANVMTVFEHRVFYQIQVRFGLEKQRATEESPCLNDNDAATRRISLIDDGLYLIGLEYGAVVHHPMVGNPVGYAQLADIGWRNLAEPLWNRRAVRKQLLGHCVGK